MVKKLVNRTYQRIVWCAAQRALGKVILSARGRLSGPDQHLSKSTLSQPAHRHANNNPNLCIWWMVRTSCFLVSFCHDFGDICLGESQYVWRTHHYPSDFNRKTDNAACCVFASSMLLSELFFKLSIMMMAARGRPPLVCMKRQPHSGEFYMATN